MRFFSTSVRRRVVVLLGGVTFAFVLLGLAWRAHERARSQAVFEQQHRDAEHMVASILDLRARTTANFVRDYTFWDELVDFVATGDREWASANLEDAGDTFAIDGLFVFDESGRPVYTLEVEGEDYLRDLGLKPSRFGEAFGGAPFAHFFLRSDNELHEVHGAKIHKSEDAERVGESFGYFFAVKRWDEEYVAALRPITGCQVTTMWPVEHKLASGAQESGIVVERDLLGSRGERVAVLIATKIIPGLDLVAHATNRAFLLFVAFAVLALAALALGLFRFIGLPLRAVTDALRRSDPEPLLPLVKAEHEFGHVARMVCESFEQRAAMLQEVERRRSSEQELARVCRRAEDVTESRMKMFAEVSHEIRSPLNGVIGMVDLLADTTLDEQQREFVSTIQSSAKTMLGVLNDVLDFAKIEEGKVVIEEIDFDLREVVEEVVALFSVQAHSKGVELTAIVPAACRTALSGDPGRIRQILINLVGNAVKYTASGEIVIEVSALPVDGERLCYSIAVRDTGMGIPPDRLHAIFEAYEQASSSDTRRHGGTGLGLTISRHLARLLGGELTVASEIGRGSTFTLECSLRRSSGYIDAEQVPSHVRAIVAARSVSTRRALAEQLKAIGCSVSENDSLAAAEAVLDQTSPEAYQAILVVDHRREDGSLGDFCRRVLRITGESSNCPVLVLTAVSDSIAASKRGENAGVEILARPAPMRMLRTSVHRAMVRGPRDFATKNANANPEKNLRGLRVLIAESYPPTQRVLQDHADALGLDVVMAHDGPSALRALEGESFAVAIIDLRLVGIDGLEVARRWREIERGRDPQTRLSIVALNAPERERSRWERAGIDDSVRGLLGADSLREVLARVCSSYVAPV